MKILLLILLSSVSFANTKHIICSGDLNQYIKRYQYTPGGITQIELQGQLITDWMKNASAQVTYIDYKRQVVTSIGRAKELVSDPKYKAIKYKDYYRFSLENLTEIKEFGKFWPSDSCQIQVMIPKNAMELRHFEAPTQVHCDQSGGVTTLTCVTR